MRGPILNITTLTLVLILTLSFGTVLLARSPNPDTNEIIDKLQQLQEKVSQLPNEAFKNSMSAEGRRNALENKIQAVIHQIKAGAFHGSLNKLQNDLKNAVTAWIKPEFAEDLIELINEIIDLIKGVKPPPKPDFIITASPDSLIIPQNSSAKSTITIQSLNNFSQPVNLSITSEPISGVTTKLNQSQVTPPSNESTNVTLTVDVALTAKTDSYTITVTGTSNTLKRTANITLEVTALPSVPDFSIEAYPNSFTIRQGGSNISIITVTSIEGFSQPVDLTITSPSMPGVNTTIKEPQVFPPSNGSAYSFLTILVATTADVSNYTITVTGSSDTLTRSTKISLEVIAPPGPSIPDFSIAAFPSSLTVQQSSLKISTLVLVSLRGFSGSVDLAVTSQPILGVTLTLSPSQVILSPNGFNSSTLTVEANASALPKEYTLTVNGSSDAIEHSVNISLRIVAEPPPIIHSVLRLPEKPNYNDTVIVMASVTDVGSGVKDVVLNYYVGVAWTNVTMTFKDGLYRANISALPYSTVVKYHVLASDRAGNWATPSSLNSYTVADSYPPVIGTPSWTPQEPDANVDITFNVTVTEPSDASGVREVTLWFKNKTLNDWKAVPMAFAGGNWTAKLSNQSDTLIQFKITAFDWAGNSKETNIQQFQVSAPEGFPLALILLIILILAALTGSAGYLLWRRRQRRKGAEAVPTPKPPSPAAPTGKPARAVEPLKGYGMVSFVVPSHNEESTISQRIADTYERAASHTGPSEIIVVDDGSVDNTYEVAWSAIKSNRKRWPNIPAKVVKLSANLGKEEAVRIGRHKATGEIVETVNNDKLTVPSFLTGFFLSI